MNGIDKIIHILAYRGRLDLAKALRGAYYELNVSSTYGSCLFSLLTTVELFAPIYQHDKLQKLRKEDKAEIIKAFHVLYPVRDNDIEINNIDFFVDPDSPIPFSCASMSILDQIDFIYITEQIAKCDQKIASADFEGAITNARNLLESVCKYILDKMAHTYDDKADLPSLYKQVVEILQMDPAAYVEKPLKQILSGCYGIVQGLATVRNILSDAHGKSEVRHYRPDERHAMLAVGAAKSLSDFLYSSFVDNVKKGK